jgi:hypothetical protein
LRAGVAVAASDVSRQEIETHLVKRAVGKYMHRLWVHQSARIYDGFWTRRRAATA